MKAIVALLAGALLGSAAAAEEVWLRGSGERVWIERDGRVQAPAKDRKGFTRIETPGADTEPSRSGAGGVVVVSEPWLAAGAGAPHFGRSWAPAYPGVPRQRVVHSEHRHGRRLHRAHHQRPRSSHGRSGGHGSGLAGSRRR